MARRYELKRRAERREKTRRRIVEAAVELHGTLGPARTSISAIAARAGVERLTVYRHFPDERALFIACSGHFRAENPFPDPEPWRAVADPEARLRTALAEVYAYHRRTADMQERVLRDLPLLPVLQEIVRPRFEHQARMRDALARGWPARGARRARLLAALGHALDFQAWRSLARGQGLEDGEAVALMVGMVRSV